MSVVGGESYKSTSHEGEKERERRWRGSKEVGGINDILKL